MQDSITLTPNFVRVVTANPGITVSPGQLVAFGNGDIETRGGCIRRLFYRDNSEDLDRIYFDNGEHITEAEAGNLKDFRESFECAAKYGLGVTFCWDRKKKTIFMVNLYPCLCTCAEEEGKGHGQPSDRFEPLSHS